MYAAAISTGLSRLVHFFSLRFWLARGSATAPRIDLLARDLDEITRRTEPEFVALTGELKALYSSAMDLSRDTRSNVASLRDALEGSGSGGCRELAARAVDELQSRLNETTLNIESLRDTASALQQLHKKGLDLERLATLLAVSRYALAVECGRTQERREAFFEFVGELERLGNQIQSLGVQIGDEANSVRAELDRLIESISAGQAELNRLESRSTSAAETASEEVQRLLGLAWSALSEAEGLTSAIVRHAEDAGYYLQFGDIIRQKLEHVFAALQDATGAFSGKHDAPGVPARSPESAIGRMLAVQSAQMDTVESEVRSAGERLEVTFAGLARETGHIAASMSQLNCRQDASHSGSDAFLDVEASLSELQKLESEAAALCEQAAAMSERARSVSSEFGHHLERVQALNQQMHLQALNAIVKTAHLGDEGGTLGVLSMHVHELARQSAAIAAATIVVLEQLNAHSRRSAPRSAGQEEVSLDLRSGLDRIRRVHQDLCAAAEASDQLAAKQQERLEEARVRLRFLSVLGSGVAGFSQELKSLNREFPAVASGVTGLAGLDSVTRRYTMASEVEVHQRLLTAETNSGASPTVLVAGTEPEPASAGAADLGDNIELF